MLAVLVSLALSLGPAAPTSTAASVSAPAPAPAGLDASPAPEPKRRLSKGQRLLIASGVSYGLGSAIQWATAGGTGMLGGARPGGSAAVTLGMTLGGMAMVQGPLLAGMAGQQLGRERPGHAGARPMLAGGAVVTTLGAGAMIGTAMMWPTIRERCPIGPGCAMTGLHLGGAALGVGAGMLAYGHARLQREPGHRRLSKDTQAPLAAGATLFASGYLLSATIGMMMWQDAPDDPVARRTRNRLLIPVVGPWIHAAGPDAPLLMAMVTGGLGALQIAGALALGVGSGLAARERRRHYARSRPRARKIHLALSPSVEGVVLSGRF